MKDSIVKTAVAESLGTFILVYFGCGSIVVNEANGDLFGLHGIAIAFGLVVMAVVYTLGHVSGAHINPAVTIALACAKKFAWRKVPAYILAQFLGAIIGAFLLKISLANGDSLGMTVVSGNLGQAFGLEVVLTAFLMFVVMGVAFDPRGALQFAPLAIGAVIIVDVLVGGSISGASLNPARSLGPALVAMQLEDIWLYLTAPVIGGVLGAYCYQWCSSISGAKL